MSTLNVVILQVAMHVIMHGIGHAVYTLLCPSPTLVERPRGVCMHVHGQDPNMPPQQNACVEATSFLVVGCSLMFFVISLFLCCGFALPFQG